MSESYNVYTSGAFIEAASVLYRITQEQSYYDAAIKAIEYVIKNKTTNDIMSNGTWMEAGSLNLPEVWECL